MDIREWTTKVSSFEQEAHAILSWHESSKSRIVLLEDTYAQLGAMSIKQDDLFRQALRCAESGCFRAAYVMAWAGFVDFIEEMLEADGFVRIRAVKPKWSIASLSDLREQYPEAQIIDAMRDGGFLSKSGAKALQGLLTRRNECAHPSDYYPDLNTTLGYISEILQRLGLLKKAAALNACP